MTTLREAAQQALEYLDAPSAKLWPAGTQHRIITALKAALAEPVQKPVAKVELMTTGGNAGLATRIVEIDDHLRERLRPGQLLYTAPPQRKPLTPVDLRSLYDRHATYQEEGPEASGWWDFARAIERAHGIGGQDE